MKNAICILFASALSVASAAPFVTPGMMKRNGLTDEQYQQLWAMGKNPKIDQAAARDWIFRSGRYQNVTNWLDICGTSNDFAKLSYKLQDDNFKLEETNEVIKAENRHLVSSNATLVVEIDILAETNAVLEVDAKKAQKVEKAAQKAKKKDEKNFNKWIEDTEKAKRKSSEDMADFYDAILELAKLYDGE